MQKKLSVVWRRPQRAIDVVVNQASGVRESGDIGEKLLDVFRAYGVAANIVRAGSGAELVSAIGALRHSKSEIVVAAGGDGTVSAVASKLVDSEKQLGIIPAGTLNHFAKDLNIPLDLTAAVEVVLDGFSKEIDVAEVNGAVFINNSSLGLYPSIVSEREKKERLGFKKWPALLWALITVLHRYPFLDVKLRVEEEEFVSRSPFVFIGNNEYEMESFNIGARSCIDAGELSLYITHRTGRLGLLRLGWRALFGGLRKEKDFTALCAKEVWIETRRKVVRVAMDGEVRTMAPPLHYRVRPKALRVLVPRS